MLHSYTLFSAEVPVFRHISFLAENKKGENVVGWKKGKNIKTSKQRFW
jgi:hypothetical protein